MPIYLYRCSLESCQHEFEIYHSIKADYLIYCPICDQPTLNVVPFAVGVFVRGEPKTVGMLAERNTKKLGNYGREDYWAKSEENKIKAREAAKEELIKKLPKGASPVELPKETPKIGGIDIGKPGHRITQWDSPEGKRYIEKGKIL